MLAYGLTGRGSVTEKTSYLQSILSIAAIAFAHKMRCMSKLAVIPLCSTI